MSHAAIIPSVRFPVVRDPRGLRAACWIVGLALIAGYVVYYAWLISRNAAIPHMDKANYVCKVYAIQDAWATRPWYQALNPALYLSAEPRQRPPLMMIPAALLGRGATPEAMAFLWLEIRMAGLLAAVGLRRSACWPDSWARPALSRHCWP